MSSYNLERIRCLARGRNNDFNALDDIDHKWRAIAGKIILDGSVDDPENERTGTGTISLFGEINFSHDLNTSFPLISLKKVSFKQIKAELLWMLAGFTDLTTLKLLGGGSIWDSWADETGSLGPVYGHQWRHWLTPNGNLIDQIKELQNNLLTKPFSRRHVVSCWNVADLADDKIAPKENPKNGKMALSPCHHEFQVKLVQMTNEEAVKRYLCSSKTEKYTPCLSIPTRRLDLKLNMRSNDWFVGAPYNIAAYALLALMLARYTNSQPGFLHYSVGDAHIYLNHFDQFAEIFQRCIETDEPAIVTLKGLPTKNIWDYEPDDIVLSNYHPQSALKAEVAV